MPWIPTEIPLFLTIYCGLTQSIASWQRYVYVKCTCKNSNKNAVFACASRPFYLYGRYEELTHCSSLVNRVVLQQQ